MNVNNFLFRICINSIYIIVKIFYILYIYLYKYSYFMLYNKS